MDRLKIMMIDPWGINSIALYTDGLCKGISEYEDLTLITNYYNEITSEGHYKIIPTFFRVSEKMKNGKNRKIIRGIEYFYSYRKVISELKKNKYDIVHIQWLLQYKVDIHFLKEIRKYCKKIVYTAHNVVPHINGDKYINKLRNIYGLVDTIVVHGNGIREEFKNLFSEFNNKVVIQRHGIFLNTDIHSNEQEIDNEIINKVKSASKVFIFFGNIFYNKGVDRLVEIWIKSFKGSNNLLIIAGRKNGEYKELDDLEKDINQCNNIIYINRYIENNLLNYLISKSDIILMPYRHASMSGLIFTAAEFKKTVLCTNTGAISEYVIDGQNSFIVENRDDNFREKLEYIATNIDNDELANMGNKLQNYIIDKYSWSNISKKLIEDAYKI